MDRDSKKMRGDRPFVFTNLKDKTGLDMVIHWIQTEVLLESEPNSIAV
jgi:urease accessory protein